MTDPFALLLAYLFAGFLIFIICVFIVRWVFKIDDIIAYQKKQYMMLRQIAYKSGVDEEKILEIDNPYLRTKRN